MFTHSQMTAEFCSLCRFFFKEFAFRKKSVGSGDSQGSPRPLSHPFSSCEKIMGLGTLHFVFYTSIKFETQKGCVSGEQTQHVRENG